MHSCGNRLSTSRRSWMRDNEPSKTPSSSSYRDSRDRALLEAQAERRAAKLARRARNKAVWAEQRRQRDAEHQIRLQSRRARNDLQKGPGAGEGEAQKRGRGPQGRADRGRGGPREVSVRVQRHARLQRAADDPTREVAARRGPAEDVPPRPQFPGLDYYRDLPHFEEFSRDCLAVAPKQGPRLRSSPNITTRIILKKVRELIANGIPPRILCLKARQVGV